MNFSAQPVSLTPMSLWGENQGMSFSLLGKAFSLKPSLAAQAADQVLMGPAGMNHIAKSQTPTGLNSLQGLPSHSDAELREVSKNFESIFMGMLMKEMRNSVQKSGLLGNSQGMEFFQSMYDQQLTQQLASSGGIGIGQMVYDRLKQITQPHQRAFS